MKFAVQASTFGAQINVGRVSKKGNAFLDKEEATDMVIAAVGQYVQRNFGDGDRGGMVATFPGLGFSVEIKVEPMLKTGDDE